MAEQTSISYYQTEFKFNGKELDQETGLYYYGARYYDPSLSIWMSVDPLAKLAPDKTPYHYVSNNPIIRIDPKGLTDYKINKDSGKVERVGKPNDQPDRILKTDSDGNIQYYKRRSKRGQPKVAVDNIKKGYLKNGHNFKEQRIMFEVDNDGELKSVYKLISYLSDKFSREGGGFTFTAKNSDKVTNVLLFGFKHGSRDGFEFPGRVARRTRSSSINSKNGKIYYKEMFHTHLSDPVASKKYYNDDNFGKDVLQLRKIDKVNSKFLDTFILAPGGVRRDYNLGGLIDY